ncbi:MAG: OmpA family protein [Burkholderiales bacterium]|nr:OmpA family protein [Burkholderiales bacterium]
MTTSNMNKLVLGVAALAVSGLAFAGVTPNVTDAAGNPVRDASGNCVQSSGINHPDCMPKKAAEPAKPAAPATPAAPSTPAAPAKPADAPKAPASVKQAITIQAEALFDFDKSVLKPEGMKALDEAVPKLKGLELEVVIVTGHTDSIGSEAYNQKLSERRAATVRDYLRHRGISGGFITMLGKGETQPVASNKTEEGRAKNRRVEVQFKAVKQ